MAKDPVCSMQVAEKSATPKSEYKGETYYFCGHACKKTFDENPDMYTGSASRDMAGHGDQVKQVKDKLTRDIEIGIETDRHQTS